MTKGNPVRLIIKFAIPLIASNLLQQVYSIVDSAIVGRGCGISALAAVGAADWLNWFVIWVIHGFTLGFSILTAQTFGANDMVRLRKSVTMSVVLCVIISAVMTTGCLAALLPALRFLNTPAEIIGGSLEYLQIIFSAIGIVAAYNMSSAILRALGDSRTPLVAMIIATVINVVLDIVFVLWFHWGLRGAAAATVAAQLFSFLYCLYKLRQLPLLKMNRKDWQFSPGVCWELQKLGVPIALSMAVITIGGMVVQFVVNRYGVSFVAGFTATNKLYGLLESISLALGFAVSTFVGHNYGALQLQRIRQGLRQMVPVMIVTSSFFAVVFVFTGKLLLRMFISESEVNAPEVEAIAYKYLMIMSVCLVGLYAVNIYRSAAQALGCAASSSFSGVVELAMRATAVLLLPQFFGKECIYFAEPAAWFGAALYLFICFYWELNKIEKNNLTTRISP